MKKLIIAIIFTLLMSSYSFAEEGDDMDQEYKNVVETEISGHSHGYHGEIEEFGYNVPFKIYYNDSYKTNSGWPLTINEVVLIDGIPTLKVTVNTKEGIDRAECDISVRCYTSNDEFTDLKSAGMGYLVKNGETQIEAEPLLGHELESFFRKNTVQSIEVRVDEYDYSQK